MQKYKFLDHTADIKFQAFGKSLKEVFENSVLAVSEVIAKEKKGKERKIKEIIIKERDNEAMLQNLLEEVIYLFDSKGIVVSKAKIVINKKKLNVELYGSSAKNYKELNHIKAVTYSEMFVKKIKDKWVAQVVLDV